MNTINRNGKVYAILPTTFEVTRRNAAGQQPWNVVVGGIIVDGAATRKEAEFRGAEYLAGNAIAFRYVSAHLIEVITPVEVVEEQFSDETDLLKIMFG